MKGTIIFLALTYGVLSSPIEEAAMKEFLAGNHEFSAGVYREISKYERSNFVVSPISAETVLAMAQEGARGETGVEFAAGLSLPSSPQKTQYAFKNFLPLLKRSQEGLKMLPANRIYVADDVTLEDSFKDIINSVYYSDVEPINFGRNVNAANNINKWVEQNTHNKIRNLVNSADYNENTKLVLVNAFYFSGEWVHKFHPDNTTREDFHRSCDESVEVDTMSQVGHFNYYEHPTIKAQMIELPYKGGDINMVIVLPNEGVEISTVEKSIKQLMRPQPFKKTKVSIEIPKFKTETRIPFVPILENMGIKIAFREGADFSAISATDRTIISDVIQKAFISIDERGTDAAAGTSVCIPTMSYDPSEPIPFKANRPFMYYITYNGVVTFAGKINDFELEN